VLQNLIGATFGMLLRSNDSTADLSIVYEGGERIIKDVKNWKEVLETFERFKESAIRSS